MMVPDDVRLAPTPCKPDLRRGEAPLPGACLQDSHTAQRKALGVALAWPSGHTLRC